jgi:hypothetical protein
MIRSTHRNRPAGLAALRRLAARSPQQERCDLCATVLSGEHEHLVDPANRRLLCACNACAVLFDHSGVTRYRRIPRDIRGLPDFEIGDSLWNSLAIPIGLVFFFRSSVTNIVKGEGFGSVILAVYPSPAGPTETVVEEELWQALTSIDGAVAGLLTDVEALLVNRTRGARDYCIVPIDQCYKLVGLIRRHWTGISGGGEVWEQTRLFFDSLRERARPTWRVSHA